MNTQNTLTAPRDTRRHDAIADRYDIIAGAATQELARRALEGGEARAAFQAWMLEQFGGYLNIVGIMPVSGLARLWAEQERNFDSDLWQWQVGLATIDIMESW